VNVILSGQYVSSASVDTGETLTVLSGGTAVSTTVTSGGLEIVSAGAADSAALIATGGSQSVLGTVYSATVQGYQIVSSGGIAAGTFIRDGGSGFLEGFEQVVFGGLVTSATVNGGLNVGSGGVALWSTIDTSGFAFVDPGGEINAAVLSGGDIIVSGGYANDVQIDSGAFEDLIFDFTPEESANAPIYTPQDSGAVITGGVQIVGFGVAYGATITAGGQQQVAGSAIATTVDSGGTQEASGHISADFIASGGLTIIGDDGVDSNSVVISGGIEVVSSGGAAYDTYVAGGTLRIAGVAVAPTVQASGLIMLEAGGTLSSSVLFVGPGPAQLAIGGTTMPTAIISGFTAGDEINLVDIAPGSNATATLNSVTDELAVVLGAQKYSLRLAGDFSGIGFEAIGDGGSGTFVEETGLACYVAGTRIATPVGEVLVEGLAVGDLVLTAEGRVAPVRWTGRRRVDCSLHPRPHDVLPIRIAVDAFGPGRPRRDLYLSPDHAVLCGSVLIPVRYLVNGLTVASVPVAAVTYFHLELDKHSVILAEGMPTESYLDTGNRNSFESGGPVLQLYSEFAPKTWKARSFAPLVLGGPHLVTAKRDLLARAIALGHDMTDDPNLRVFANGQSLVTVRDGDRWRVRLPSGTRTVRLVSLTWCPAHSRADEFDSRRLGVAISHMWLDGLEVSLESPGMSTGWHTPEQGWRWTGGDAKVMLSGVQELAFEVVMTGSYWQDREPDEAQVA
jgi:collagen type I alpha